MIERSNITIIRNKNKRISFYLLSLLLLLLLISNAESGSIENDNMTTQSSFANSTHIYKNGLINEFGIYRTDIKTKNVGHGFFIHNDIDTALGSLGVHLLNNGLNHKAIKGKGVAGYGYKYNDEATLLFGLNLPNTKIQESAYISFTVGSAW